jgi:hypothetical protein
MPGEKGTRLPVDPLRSKPSLSWCRAVLDVFKTCWLRKSSNARLPDPKLICPLG